MEYVSRSEHYQKVKKPIMERQRRARINKCLDTLKHMVAEYQKDDLILRLDKAEMLETTIACLRQNKALNRQQPPQVLPIESFRHGYMNAVNEVSRVLASTPGVEVDFGKSVMTHLGCQFNRLQQLHVQQYQQSPVAVQQKSNPMVPLVINTSSVPAPLSPASSGYHSDMDSPAASPVVRHDTTPAVWRPW